MACVLVLWEPRCIKDSTDFLDKVGLSHRFPLGVHEQWARGIPVHGNEAQQCCNWAEDQPVWPRNNVCAIPQLVCLGFS